MPDASPIDWIRSAALPFWLERGVDWKNGGFYESFSLAGENLLLPRRALVQARQIYSFRVARDMGWIDTARARAAISLGSDYLIRAFSMPSGGFAFSVSEDGREMNTALELYTQAFALFGLANAFAVTKNQDYKRRAKSLLDFLNNERRLPGGGFSEIKAGAVLYEANPHMHLFEAAIAWMEADIDPAWAQLAEALVELCLTKFIDPKSGMLAEHFDRDWQPLLEDSRYIVEPGHLFEWAWLMARYQRLKSAGLMNTQERLFELGEAHGICKVHGVVFDEIWSDGSPKLRSSRTWPQCERIKCASELGARAAADSALSVLMKYFSTPKAGLWFDRFEESGTFRNEPAKASSLYHIIGAISEHTKLGN